jgi:arylsulfatase A-like enzyme
MNKSSRFHPEQRVNYISNMTKIYRHTLHFFLIFLLIGISFSCTKNEAARRPNIVLIVADDLGYADIGSYGGDIETPNIDMLASKGVKFSSFHTAPMCSPTRSMLLSGNDNHIAGIGGQGTVSEKFGYEGVLTDRIVPVPALLKTAGYHTYMTGKWHLGKTKEANPHQKGFEHSYVLVNGAGNHYRNQGALGQKNSMYTEDGEKTAWTDGNYSTDFYTDKMIEYIDGNIKDEKPFFSFLAYTSPHWPLQVDKKHWEKYKGRYNDGYEKLKERRLKSLKKAGIISESAQLPITHKSVKPWDSLSKEQQLKEARKMELYAGMVDNLDYNIGRLIKHLKSIGEYENTLFVFMSDNGAAPRDFITLENKMGDELRKYYDDDYENMGNYNSYISYGPQWAEAGGSPFRYFKNFATQGGINTPMIISGPGIQKKNEIHYGFTTLMDLAPTFYELAEVTYPEKYNEKPVYPLKGTSLMPFLSNTSKEIHASDYVFGLEHYGNAMIRKGKWKITNFVQPFTFENFSLYNLSNDLGEQNDLKETEPEKYAEMLREWSKFSNEIKLTQSIDAKLRYIIDNEGIEIGVKKYWQLKKNEVDKFDFRVEELNNLGYFYIGKGEIEKALAVLKINVEAYPNSANVFDSYGEALLKANRKIEAIEMYEKSIEIDPENVNGAKILEKLQSGN